MRLLLTGILLPLAFQVHAQFSPDGGQPGSIAIAPDEVRWKAWAHDADFEPGYIDIANPSLGLAEAENVGLGLGLPDGSIVSLGDAGRITLGFEQAMGDMPGYDFVVFENGFPTSDSSGFFELAFVEVSSDGQRFVRFPNRSLTPLSERGSFTELDSRKIYGLAGQFSAPYGTPFDLAELSDSVGIDLSAITHIRLVDVVGSADTSYLNAGWPDWTKTDSEGSIIVDPYPTPFPGAGFDLDAVGWIEDGTNAVDGEPTPEVQPLCFAVQAGSTLPVALPQNLFWRDALGRPASPESWVRGLYWGFDERAQLRAKVMIY